MTMLWIKTLHIVFVTSWFAGLFYLPRIFVNLASLPSQPEAGIGRERERLLLMSRRLLRFMLPLAVLAIGLGLWLFIGYGIGLGPGNGWMHAKLFVVILLVGYHHSLARLLVKFEQDANTHSERWYRIYNEVPVVLLLIAVALVVIKPF